MTRTMRSRGVLLAVAVFLVTSGGHAFDGAEVAGDPPCCRGDHEGELPAGDFLCDPAIPLLDQSLLEQAEMVLPAGTLDSVGDLEASVLLEGQQRLLFGKAGTTSTTLLNETFESTWPSAGWQVGINSGKADAKWGRSTYRKAGGGYSIWCAKSGSAAPPDGGTVPKNMTTWAIVGPVNLSTYTAGSFFFDVWQQTGNGDYLFYGASTNGTNFSGWNVTANTSGFERVTRDITNWGTLGNLAGQGSVWFAFFYISNDDESRAEGAYVDNVTLTAETGGGSGSCGTYITTEDNENNAGTGTADNDMGVSGRGQCLYNTDSRHPIEFNIFVTGPLPTSSAQLFLETWDVDYPDEINDVYVNNTKVGSTTGANNQWSNPSFNIPLNLVRAGKNTVKLMVDTKNSGSWCTWVAQAQLIIDGGCQGSASCRYVNTNKTSYAPGENVQVTYEIDTTKTSQEIRVESNLKNPSGQIVAGMEKVYTTTGSGNDPQTVTLALPGGAPGGTYTAEILVFDKATGVLESTCFRQFTVTGGGGGSNCGTYITTEDNENNAGTGTADNDMGVSGRGQCLYNTDSRHPIEFNIFVTGPLPTSSAQLFLETWDVDYPDEINDVYVNNTKVGSTTGANNQWSNPSFNIPLNLVRAGKNTVKLMVDTKNSGSWCTWVAQAQLIIDGGCQGSASCRYVNTNKTSYAPGENVQVTYEIDTTKTSQEIRVESNLKNPSGQIVAGMEKVYTTTGSGNDPQTVTLALPGGAPGGTYTAEILVFDKATGVLESTCFRQFTVTGGGGGGGCTLSCTATVPASALVGQQVTFVSSATASGCTGGIEYFWFFGDGTTAVAQTQNTSYTYTAAGTYTWELVAVVQGNVVCRKTGTITVTTSSGGCSLGCSATVPATAQVGQTVTFQGSSSASGCSGSAEYFWFFGDGTTAVAQAQNTSYVYTQPGTYTWELVVVIGQTICRRSGTIIITGTVGTGCTVGCTALVPATGQVNVPVPFKASSTTANCQGTPEYFWSVDDGTTAVAQAQNTTWTFPVPGVYRWHLTVVVGGVVCRRTGTITIAAPSGCTLDCTALVPAVAQVGQSVNFRGFATWSRCSAPPIYVWDFGDRSIPAGGSTPTHTYHAPGSWDWQMTTVVDGVYCVRSGTIVVPGAGGVQPPPTGCNYSTWFQVGSRASGVLGSQWRTDVFILNLGAQAAQVTARLHAPGGVRTLAATVPGRQHRTLADVVGQMNYTGSAALELCSDQPVRAASRTYNRKSATETFGQYYRGFTSTQAMSAGQTGWLLGLKENSQFRSNIALTNSGRSTARVAVTLYDGSGAIVTAYTVTLAPSEWKQEARPFFNKGGRGNIDEGYARVDVLAGSGVEASASAIDAGTNDPTTLPALP